MTAPVLPLAKFTLFDAAHFETRRGWRQTCLEWIRRASSFFGKVSPERRETAAP
ncbi:MAG: hypothetical protein RMJ82_01010 [Gemmatales bacterium]|nr:hypothetical protein [Gemmatales bacterium]